MASLPTPIRATLGLLASALDAVQELVDHAPEIPMEAVGNSMQLSMRLQQQYVALQTRGDEFLASLRGAPDEPPAWATFDEPPAGPDVGPADAGLFDDDAGAPEQAESVDVIDDLPEAEIQDGPRHAGQGDPLLAAATRSRTVPAAAKKAPAKKAPAKRAAAKVAANEVADDEVAATTVPAKKAPGKKAAGVKAAPASKAPPVKATAVGTTTTKATGPKKVRAVKAASGKRVAKSAAPALDSASPILTAATTPAKRGRPAKKVGSRKTSTAPQLDASLTAGSTGARPQSAFDLVDTPTAVGTDEVGPGAFSAAPVAEDHATDSHGTDNHGTDSGRPTPTAE